MNESKLVDPKKSRGAYHVHGKPGNFSWKSNGTHHSIFGVLLKLWASGQSDAF